MMRNLKENRNGFTLIELMVVLVILGILAAIIIPSMMGFIRIAKEKQYVMEAQGVRKTIQMYMIQEYETQVQDPVTLYEDLTRYTLDSDKNPLYEYLTVKCSKDAMLGGLTIDTYTLEVEELTYQVDGYEISLGIGNEEIQIKRIP